MGLGRTITVSAWLQTFWPPGRWLELEQLTGGTRDDADFSYTTGNDEPKALGHNSFLQVPI